MSSSGDNGNARLGQIFDEKDHSRCSEGNKAALLAETLAHLRALTKELQQDDWMYTEKKNENISKR